VLLGVLPAERTVESAIAVARAASAFLLEAVAPFEMTQRGFMDGTRAEGH